MTGIELSYCKVCINQGIKYPLGIICKISQEKPQFVKHCDNYNFDCDEYQKLINNKTNYYKELHKKGNSLGNKINVNTMSYEQTQISEKGRLELDSRLPNELEITNSTNHYFVSHVTPSLIFIIGIAYYMFGNSVDKVMELIGLTLIAFFVGVIVWAALKIRDKKPKLTLNDKGIKLEGYKLIIWRDVLMTQIKRKEERMVFEYLCISQLSTSKEIEVSIDKLNILGWQLGHYIEMYKQKYQRL